MSGPIVLLNGLEPAARLTGAGGSVVADQGRLVLQGGFSLEICGAASSPLDFGSSGRSAVVAAEGDYYRLVESSTVDFQWPAQVRLGDSADPRAPWLRYSAARLWQVAGLTTTMVNLDHLAVSLIGDARDPVDETLVFPIRTGRDTRRLSRPLHPDFPSASGYFLYPLDSGVGVMLGTLSQRMNISHGEALELVLGQRAATLWFRLPVLTNQAATFLAQSSGARGITLTASSLGAGGILAAADPGAKRWELVDLGVKEIFSLGGGLRVATDTKTGKGGFEGGRIWLARAVVGSPVSDATGICTPTDRLELDLELPLEGEIPNRLPAMSLAYRNDNAPGSRPTSRYDRHYGVRVAGLSDRSGGAVALDANIARFKLTGTHANPALHLKAGTENDSWLAPKLAEGADERRLEIAAGDLALAINASPTPLATPLQLDTERQLFTLQSPSLVAAPVGVTSKAPADSEAAPGGYKRWRLVQSGSDTKLDLQITPSGLRATGDWAAGFTTADPTQTYSSIDHPGLGIIVDGARPSVVARAGQDVRTSFTIKQANGKEIVVYSSFVALLSYLGVRRVSEGSWAFLDPYKTLLQFNKLDDAKYVKNATAKGLQVVYVTDDAGAAQGLHDFIESNRASSENPTAPEYFWPFTNGLAIPLRSEASGTVKYADDIVKERHPDLKLLKPAIAFDMSAEASLDPRGLGWTSWGQLAAETPALWPRANDGLGARMDPSVAEWRGIVMRDLPLELAINPASLAKMPKWAQDLVAAINKYVMLEYAYRDEAGVTWKGGTKGLPPQGEKISPANWDGFFQIWFHNLTVLGAAGATRGAECDVQFILPRIKNKNPNLNAPDDSLRIRAKFGLDLDSKENPVTRVDVRYNDAALQTDSIPGFQSITLKRITTNFELVQIEVELVATATLAHALPFLSNSKPQAAFLAFNLKGDPKGVFELSLPAEAETNLFGRWPLKVQSMRLGWGDLAEVWLEITGRLSLGMAGLSSIGATVVVTKSDPNLDFDVRLNDVAVDLSLGGAEISGRLGWGNTDPKQTKVPFADIVQPRVRDRDIRGALTVKTQGFLGDNDVSFRAGNKGEINYWVAAAVHSGDDTLNLGFGKLKNPGLLVAQNADLEGRLRQLALSPEGAIFANLRPTGPAVWDWLNRWEASSSIGTVLAASGYFTIDDFLVKAPVKDTQNTQGQEKWLSGVLWIGTGVLRVDGVAKLITDKPAYFGMAVDFQERTFIASFQTEAINFGRYTFQPGRMSVGFGFGDKKYLDVRLGWPPPMGEYDRDWSQALHFHLPEVPPPVNAGWGGFMGAIRDDTITMGIAFRIGWMRGDGAARGGTGGGYSIGYALGGLMQYTLSFSELDTLSFSQLGERTALPALHPPPPISKKSSRAAAYSAVAADALVHLESTDLAIAGEWFGDVWGSAWLEFMGITLVAIELKAFARYRLAGSLNQGVTDARATCGFSVSVTILCITYTCEARYDIVAVDGGGRKVRFDEASVGRPPVSSSRPARRNIPG